MIGVAAGSMLASGLTVGPVVQPSDISATPTGVARATINPAMLRLFESAATRSGVPWEILAGLAWAQTRDGQQAPGETISRVPVAEDQPSTPSGPSLFALSSSTSGTTSMPRVFPELVPPITTPGYGMWLLTSPWALADDPQSVPATVNDMATLMARQAAKGDGGMPFSRLRSADLAADPAAQAGWERIIAGLPVVLQGGPTPPDGLASQAAALAENRSSAAEAVGRAVAYVSPPACGGGAAWVGSATILGGAQASEAQTLAWYQSQGSYASSVNGTSAAQLVEDYYRVGAAEGVRADWALIQAVLETGGFRSPDTLLNNFAGIAHPDWATSGSPFASVAAGVVAQIQLLKRVASGNAVSLVLPAAPNLPTWGGRTAETWAGLASNWASAPDYGISLETLHGDLTGTSTAPACAVVLSVSASPVTVSTAALAAPRHSVSSAEPLGPAPSAAPGGTSRAAGDPPATTTTVPPPTGSRATGPPTSPPPRSDAAIDAVIHFALNQVGKPWQADGNGPDAWDASGLLRGAWSAAGLALPAGPSGLTGAGVAVARIDQALPGDLVFQAGTAPLSGPQPVGVYRGDGTIIAVLPGEGVQLLAVSHWAAGELSVRRITTPVIPAAPSPRPPTDPPGCASTVTPTSGTATTSTTTASAVVTTSPSQC